MSQRDSDWLTADERRALSAALIERGGYRPEFRLLLLGRLSVTIRAELPVRDRPGEQISSDLAVLCAMSAEPGCVDPPLAIWLDTAATLCDERDLDGQPFRDWARCVRQRALTVPVVPETPLRAQRPGRRAWCTRRRCHLAVEPQTFYRRLQAGELDVPRSQELRQLALAVVTSPLVCLVGRSGSGKSSLVRRAVLERPTHRMLPVYLSSWGDGSDRVLRLRLADALGAALESPRPIEATPAAISDALAAVSAAGRRALFVLDQFDEFLIQRRTRAAPVDEGDVLQIIRDGVRQGHHHCLVVSRDSTTAELGVMRPVEPRIVCIGGLDADAVRALLTRFATAEPPLVRDPEYGWWGLVDRIVEVLDRGGGRVLPVDLHIALARLRSLEALDSRAFDAYGGPEALSERLVDDHLSRVERRVELSADVMTAMLCRLVDPASGVATPLDTDALRRSLEGYGWRYSAAAIEAAVGALCDAGLLRRVPGREGGRAYCLSHDRLAPTLIRRRQRVLRPEQQLAATARVWRRAESPAARWGALPRLPLLWALLRSRRRAAGAERGRVADPSAAIGRRLVIGGLLRLLALVVVTAALFGIGVGALWFERQERRGRALDAIVADLGALTFDAVDTPAFGRALAAMQGMPIDDAVGILHRLTSEGPRDFDGARRAPIAMVVQALVQGSAERRLRLYREAVRPHVPHPTAVWNMRFAGKKWVPRSIRRDSRRLIVLLSALLAGGDAEGAAHAYAALGMADEADHEQLARDALDPLRAGDVVPWIAALERQCAISMAGAVGWGPHYGVLRVRAVATLADRLTPEVRRAFVRALTARPASGVYARHCGPLFMYLAATLHVRLPPDASHGYLLWHRPFASVSPAAFEDALAVLGADRANTLHAALSTLLVRFCDGTLHPDDALDMLVDLQSTAASTVVEAAWQTWADHVAGSGCRSAWRDRPDHERRPWDGVVQQRGGRSGRRDRPDPLELPVHAVPEAARDGIADALFDALDRAGSAQSVLVLLAVLSRLPEFFRDQPLDRWFTRAMSAGVTRNWNLAGDLAEALAAAVPAERLDEATRIVGPPASERRSRATMWRALVRDPRWSGGGHREPLPEPAALVDGLPRQWHDLPWRLQSRDSWPALPPGYERRLAEALRRRAAREPDLWGEQVFRRLAASVCGRLPAGPRRRLLSGFLKGAIEGIEYEGRGRRSLRPSVTRGLVDCLEPADRRALADVTFERLTRHRCPAPQRTIWQALPPDLRARRRAEVVEWARARIDAVRDAPAGLAVCLTVLIGQGAESKALRATLYGRLLARAGTGDRGSANTRRDWARRLDAAVDRIDDPDIARGVAGAICAGRSRPSRGSLRGFFGRRMTQRTGPGAVVARWVDKASPGARAAFYAVARRSSIADAEAGRAPHSACLDLYLLTANGVAVSWGEQSAIMEHLLDLDPADVDPWQLRWVLGLLARSAALEAAPSPAWAGLVDRTLTRHPDLDLVPLAVDPSIPGRVWLPILDSAYLVEPQRAALAEAAGVVQR